MLKPLDFPRENSRIFEMKVNGFAMAKTTFFSKTLKTLARFSPRRDVFTNGVLGVFVYFPPVVFFCSGSLEAPNKTPTQTVSPASYEKIIA